MASSPSLQRFLDWCLLRPQIREVRARSAPTPREKTLLERAERALAVGNDLLESASQGGDGTPPVQAGSAYLDALYWSLLPAADEGSMPEIASLWGEARELRDALKLPEAEATSLEALLAMKRPSLELAERPAAEQGTSIELLRSTATRVVEIRERSARALVHLRTKAAVRTGAVAVLLVVLAVFVGTRVSKLLERPTVAGGTGGWTTSSKLPDCETLPGQCGGAETSIFFHTQFEDGPWIRYDLKEPRKVTGLHVKNRAGHESRAVPLVVEVSDDGQTFREVIRRGEPFDVWDPTFPEQKARYVRLRVAAQTYLHLEEVRILP